MQEKTTSKLNFYIPILMWNIGIILWQWRLVPHLYTMYHVISMVMLIQNDIFISVIEKVSCYQLGWGV